MTVALITNGLIAPTDFVLNLAANISAELENDSQCGTQSGQLILIKANSVVLDFLVASNGVRLTQSQLEAADDIFFMVKQDPVDPDADAVISKSVGDGIEVLPDSNSSANLRVTLLSGDTDIDPGVYSVGLQVNFSSTDIKEADLKQGDQCFNEIYISQDVIR